ncbi:MAG: translation initiation factor 2 [Lachnospiraceae bacterium]|nr:translation initiation factor 2 [Lachnospiraceae bacterium]
MKGKYHFKVRSKRALFDFTIRRNITILKGDSATGKTTLLHMLYEYLRVGRESGFTVSSDASYFVYLRKEVGRDWKDALFPLKNTIIFIEENNDFVFGRDFADFVKSSGNYFVLVNRAPFRMLPYSIHEIYEIITAGKRTDIRESYHEFKELYSHYPVVKHNKVENIITEDSCSGHQFFTTVFGTADVVSADGNSNILPVIQTLVKGDTLVIADGAAFGAMIENCLAYLETRIDLRVSIWLPESFEYLILKSGVIKAAELEAVLEEPADYIDSLQHESWEQFFTDLLISLTKDTAAKYSKEVLNKYYLQDKNIRKIELQFPDVINLPEKSR